MNIKGEKVLLRAIEMSDAEMLRSLINNSEIEAMLGGWSFPISEAQQQKWFDSLCNSNTSTLRVIIDVDGVSIGTAILSDIDCKNGNAEIHIKTINGENRGKGYGKDTVKALVDYAFNQMRLHVVYARINESNEKSKHLFSSCGFECEGTLRDRIYKNGQYANVLVYSIVNE